MLAATSRVASTIINVPSGGISAADLQSAINELDAEKQPLDAELTALAGVTSAADKVPYFTGSGTAAVADLTAAGRALIDDANAAAQRTTLGLAIGTDVQGYDAELAALAGLTSAANKVPYFTGSGTADVADLTAAGRALIDDADTAAQRTTLGLVIGTNVQAFDAELAAIAGLTSAADKVPYFTGSGTAAVADFTGTGRSIVAVANAAALVALIQSALDAQFTLADGATITIDYNNGRKQRTAALGGSRTVAFSNFPDGGKVEWTIVDTDENDLTWPMGVIWNAGSEPAMPTSSPHGVKFIIEKNSSDYWVELVFNSETPA